MFFWYLGQPVAVVGLERKDIGVGLFRGAIWVLALLCLTWLLLSLVGKKTWASNPLEEQVVTGYIALYAKSSWWTIFLYWFQALWMAFFVGVTEEIEYRGILYGALRKQIYAPAAIAISALSFAAAHGEFNPLHFLFGWLAASLTEKHRSLIPAIVIHIMWNFGRNADPWFLGIMKVVPGTYYFSAAAMAGSCLLILHLYSRSRARTESVSSTPSPSW